MGKLSRTRGKHFELRVARLLPSLLDAPVFRRTQRGDRQMLGDLIACDKCGMPDANCQWYIECRQRSQITPGMIRTWAREILRKARYVEHTWLCYGQHNGIVYAMCLDGYRDDWPLPPSYVLERGQHNYKEKTT